MQARIVSTICDWLSSKNAMKFGNIVAFLVNNPESPMLKLPKQVTRISDGMVKSNETVLST